MSAIVASHLHRRFGQVEAVVDLSLAVEDGEIYGLIGPDGAGKTTTLRMLAAVLKPTGGTATVAGYDVVRQSERLRRLVGYMPQHFSLYGDLSVMENLTFFADIFGVRGRERRERIERLLHFAQLEAFTGRAAAHLSGGMKKKLALACCLIHRPQVLLLDEPTNGVDPVSRREFWDILGDLHLEGVTILVTTPYMDEAERCNQVGLMHAGRIIRQGAPAELRSLTPGVMLAVYTPHLLQAEAVLPEAPGYLAHQVYGDRVHVFLQEEHADPSRLQEFLRARDIVVQLVRRDTPRLEEAFVHLMSRES
ncbi:MAG: ABC transporter ATP-binding protein [Caldilineae bacterium]|nr:MAG: ABC transporter ATP-binding protein [Caldilineae bacterium]